VDTAKPPIELTEEKRTFDESREAEAAFRFLKKSENNRGRKFIVDKGLEACCCKCRRVRGV
jgi:hypothetical protein